MRAFLCAFSVCVECGLPLVPGDGLSHGQRRGGLESLRGMLNDSSYRNASAGVEVVGFSLRVGCGSSQWGGVGVE